MWHKASKSVKGFSEQDARQKRPNQIMVICVHGKFLKGAHLFEKAILTFKLDDKEALAVGGSRAIFSREQLCLQGTTGNVWMYFRLSKLQER